MDSLDKTSWDVVIAGTGLQQSLLALALSRSGKKILHLDRDDFYGGSEASFSLQEAEAWLKSVSSSTSGSRFRNCSIQQTPPTEGSDPSLSFSRAYTLALAPGLMYARSELLPLLVSSKVYKQLEFQAVGSWWVSQSSEASDGAATAAAGHSDASLFRVPASREDVFTEDSLGLTDRRKMMKFLRFVVDIDNQPDTWQPYASKPFADYLEHKFGLSQALQQPLFSMTLSQTTPREHTTSDALHDLERHLTSFGVFGRGFGAVIPRWGGLSEIAQVGCRAAAVGGATYMLGTGIRDTSFLEAATSSSEPKLSIQLTNGDQITASWLVGGEHDIPSPGSTQSAQAGDTNAVESLSICHLISIVSSPLGSLFPSIGEGSPPAAAAIVYFPPGSLSSLGEGASTRLHPPVYVQVHTSDTGECPPGQCVLYSSVPNSATSSFDILRAAVDYILKADAPGEMAGILWSMQYERSAPKGARGSETIVQRSQEPILRFPSFPDDIAFDDTVLRQVKHAWLKIVGEDGDNTSFMQFKDREEEIQNDDPDIGA